MAICPRGTTFQVYLPRTDSPEPSRSPAPDASVSLEGRETVLLVKDDVSVCELIRAVLRAHGYTVLTPTPPQKAEELFEAHGRRVESSALRRGHA